MKTKLFSLIAIFIIISLTIAGCSSSSSNTTQENGTVTLKVATYVPVESPVYKYITEPWMKRVTEITDGKVQFDAYPGEQLGKAHDLLQLTRDGVTDIGVFPANYFPDNMPLSNALAGLPNLSMSAYQGTMAYNDLLQQNSNLLKTDYLNNGIRPILANVSPTYEIWTINKELRVPEDLKGLKTRTPGGIANELYEYMGAVPVAVSHTETYEALEKGVIDALSYSSVGVKGSGTNEILKYAIFPQIGTAIHGVVINEKVWQGLPEDIQKAMTQAGEELMEQSGKNYDKDTQAINDEFINSGGTIVKLTKEEQDKWMEVTEDFTQSWLSENDSTSLPYKEVLDMYKDHLKTYK